MSREKVKSLRKNLKELKKKKGKFGNLVDAIKFCIRFGDGTVIDDTLENKPLIEAKIAGRPIENDSPIEENAPQPNVESKQEAKTSEDTKAPPFEPKEAVSQSPVPSQAEAKVEVKKKDPIPEDAWIPLGSFDDLVDFFR
jgi:hypothetical protein